MMNRNAKSGPEKAVYYAIVKCLCKIDFFAHDPVSVSLLKVKSIISGKFMSTLYCKVTSFQERVKIKSPGCETEANYPIRCLYMCFVIKNNNRYMCLITKGSANMVASNPIKDDRCSIFIFESFHSEFLMHSNHENISHSLGVICKPDSVTGYCNPYPRDLTVLASSISKICKNSYPTLEEHFKEIIEDLDKSAKLTFIDCSLIGCNSDFSDQEDGRVSSSLFSKACSNPNLSKPQKSILDRISSVTKKIRSKKLTNSQAHSGSCNQLFVKPSAVNSIHFRKLRKKPRTITGTNFTSCMTQYPEFRPKGFHEILNNKVAVEYFRKYLIYEHSVENLDFYGAVMKWKSASKDSFHGFKKSALQIYSDFMAPDGKSQINVDFTVMNAVRNELFDLSLNKYHSFNAKGENCDLVPITLFDKALRDIYGLMQKDSFARFLDSDIYDEYLMALQHYNSRPAKRSFHSMNDLSVIKDSE